ncbi:YkvA family protein [Marinisporobacter balticus]|uniref:Uncharacterized protein DUF1232 n=1 Tax=Marinisporobacter balticus TaxID=2018667 RepID=A0A4R2L5N0_9FIRM|nr:DUF1232 domain-containing protein [Marinisporobacter balticus]TCO79349.1 uncharacterized protein DUF1232 [Marinisporobacter balticus]
MVRNVHRNMNFLKTIIKLFKRISVIHKLIKDPNVAFYKKIMVISGLIYFISPIDLVPEIVLGFGFIDDAVLILYIVSKISDELDRYIKKDQVVFEEDKIIEDIKYKMDDE